MNLALLVGVAGLMALKSSKGSGKKGSAKKSLSSNRGILTSATRGFQQIKLPMTDWPDMVFSIPFGSGVSQPVWPTVSSHRRKFTVSYRTVGGDFVGNAARRFMAKRGDAKYHVGIDLYANDGDLVLACESGQIINIYHFYHGAYAMIVQCASGLVINYGEVKRNSWKEFGLGEGSEVQKGQPIARIGTMSGGSSMLHFETYMRPTEKNIRYFGGATEAILNPTYYLLRARYFSDSGRAYAGSAACKARKFQTMTPANSLEVQIAREEREQKVEPTDSVLAELNEDKFRSVDAPPNRADGP